MAISFRNLDGFGFAPLTPESLSVYEAALGCRFPDDYRGFLLTHNGAVPDGDYSVPFVSHDGQPDASLLHVLFGFQELNRSSADIRSNVVGYGDRLPSGFLPIGRNPGGDLFLLRVAGAGLGEVWFWDHESEFEVTEDRPLANVGLVATSFSDFLAACEPFEG